MSHLNHDVLSTLREALGDEDFFEIIHTFAEQFERQLQAFRQHAARGESSECARILHSLKGGAGNIGAQSLAEVAEQFEALMRQGDVGIDPVIIEALSNTTRDTLDELRNAGYLAAR
jgi:HPt (histidine-containing phosphotransfer) domain-containing protein